MAGTRKGPPTFVGNATYLDRSRAAGTSLVRNPYYNESGSPEKIKKMISDSTQETGLDRIKWGKVTHVPPPSADNRSFWGEDRCQI